MKSRIVLFAMTAALAGSACAWADGTPCEGLTKLTLPHTEVTSATVIAKGAFTPPRNNMGGGPPPQQQATPAGANQAAGGPGGLGGQAGPGVGPGGPAAPRQGGGGGGQNAVYATMPSFCRVMATSRPTPDSEIKMEIWLPVEGWNNRLEETGNGAFGSTPQWGDMAAGVVKNYAVAANNTGHEGQNGDFAFGHPEKLIDWGYRAVHETTVTAKAVVAAYYGSGPKYSYWNSCSTGGRQGLIAAEYYPDDFDGIAAGDAANPMTRLQSSTLWGNLAVNKSPESIIPPAKVTMYKNAVLEACDAADGIKDGIINNPLACNFDPKTLLCKNGDAPDCLTAPQLEALQKVIEGPKNPRTGAEVYPGWHVGTLPGNFVWGAKPEQVSIDIFRGLFQDPSWDYHTIDFDKDIARSDKLGNTVVNAVDETRLKTLFAHGGKMLLYHGWNDGSIPPLSAIEYYNKAAAANGGVSKTYSDMRLFMIPGGNHCGPGDGPAVFDKLDVISQWVEQGKAPDEIVASHLIAGKVDRTRPLCPYPQIAEYKGTGSTDEAQNFVCAAQ